MYTSYANTYNGMHLYKHTYIRHYSTLTNLGVNLHLAFQAEFLHSFIPYWIYWFLHRRSTHLGNLDPILAINLLVDTHEIEQRLHTLNVVGLNSKICCEYHENHGSLQVPVRPMNGNQLNHCAFLFGLLESFADPNNG